MSPDFNMAVHSQGFSYFSDFKVGNFLYRTRVRSLVMLVTNSLTDSLTDSLPFSGLDGCE